MTKPNEPARSDTNSPVLVEFVGVPGGGKSTLARELACDLRADSLPVRTPVSEVNTIESRIHRVQRKSTIIARYALRHPRRTVGWIRTVRRLSGGVRRDTVNVGFYWLFVAGALSCYRGSDGVTIADQGLFQAYWSAVLGNPTPPEDVIRSIIEAEFRETQLVVVLVEVDVEEARRRLAARSNNPSRISADVTETAEGISSYSVRDAQSAYNHIEGSLTAIEDEFGNVSVIRCVNDERSDIDPNVQAIASELFERLGR